MTSTGWVWPTFKQLQCPQSWQCCCQLTWQHQEIPWEKILGIPRFEHRATGCEALMLPLCCATRLALIFFEGLGSNPVTFCSFKVAKSSLEIFNEIFSEKIFTMKLSKSQKLFRSGKPPPPFALSFTLFFLKPQFSGQIVLNRHQSSKNKKKMTLGPKLDPTRILIFFHATQIINFLKI